MVRALLVRGLMAGLIAGLLGFGFAKLAGELQVNSAIAFEERAAAARGDAHEPVLVSRDVQSGWGLFTGIEVYATALGGLFALVFAFAWGRLAWDDPKVLAAALALAALLVITIFPALKYPPNPPAIGQPDTIERRTALYFVMLGWSLLSAAVATFFARKLKPSLGAWHAFVAGCSTFIILTWTVSDLLPDINEVPAAFPAVLLWRFRLAALGLQSVIWLSLGLGYGWLVDGYFGADSGNRGSITMRKAN
jgi:hypothetical protein